MAFPVEFFYFNKRMNSTAQPDVTGATYQCLLKSPSSIVSPTLILQLPTAVNPSLYNYCYIDIYHRYYYVREMTFNDACWEIDLVVDPLASWKTNIGEYSGYILRSSSSYDGSIMDMTYPANSSITKSIVTDDTGWTTDITRGTFLVGIAGTSTQYYAFSYETFNGFLNQLFSDDYANDLLGGDEWTSVFPELKAQSNPMQYITSVYWIPNTSAFIGTTTSVKVGWVDVMASAIPIGGGSGSLNETIMYSNTLAIPKHPQSGSRGEYLNISPFSHYSLYYPCFGQFDLNPAEVGNCTSITTRLIVDMRIGSAKLYIYGVQSGQDNILLTQASGQIGAPFQISQIYNVGFGASNIISAVGGIASSVLARNPAGAIETAASAIGDAASSFIPSARTVGSNGSLADYITATTGINDSSEIILQGIFNEVVAEDFDHRGRPLCQVKQISSIPGFIMCADADIGIWGTVDEQQQIREYMEEGFFYE